MKFSPFFQISMARRTIERTLVEIKMMQERYQSQGDEINRLKEEKEIILMVGKYFGQK